MARTKTHTCLRVFHNEEEIGLLSKQPSGAVEFAYTQNWLNKPEAVPVSLSLPVIETPYKGAPVLAVFENLLPDSQDLRKAVAEKVGADGTDAYSLLTKIGHDCVGALQFLPENTEINIPQNAGINAKTLDEHDIEKTLNNLSKAPLGISADDDFRISIAGAQEKTALLFHNDRWKRPYGTTPTTHILKTQIGSLPSGIDLSDSVENEYYCLSLLRAFGLPVNHTEIMTFGKTKSLVIERFDRQWMDGEQLLRLPQEDMCQALSIPPSRKYQNDTQDPKQTQASMKEVLTFLKASDRPLDDQKKFLQAQILFWLIGATDGHAKNFSVFLGPQGQFYLTPFYDVLTAQPYLDAGKIQKKQFKMAMSVGDNNHYTIEDIQERHFIQTAKSVGINTQIVDTLFEEIRENAQEAFKNVEGFISSDTQAKIHKSVKTAFFKRLQRL